MNLLRRCEIGPIPPYLSDIGPLCASNRKKTDLAVSPSRYNPPKPDSLRVGLSYSLAGDRTGLLMHCLFFVAEGQLASLYPDVDCPALTQRAE